MPEPQRHLLTLDIAVRPTAEARCVLDTAQGTLRQGYPAVARGPLRGRAPCARATAREGGRWHGGHRQVDILER